MPNLTPHIYRWPSTQFVNAVEIDVKPFHGFTCEGTTYLVARSRQLDELREYAKANKDTLSWPIVPIMIKDGLDGFAKNPNGRWLWLSYGGFYLMEDAKLIGDVRSHGIKGYSPAVYGADETCTVCQFSMHPCRDHIWGFTLKEERELERLGKMD